jgi:hypothetical protein
MKMLFLVFALAVLVGPGFAQDGRLLGLDKPTDCVMTRIKSIDGRLEGTSPRESGVAVEYENGAYGVQYQLGDNPDRTNPVTAISGSKRHMRTTSSLLGSATPSNCLVSIPLRCPKGDGRGREHTALNLRNHRWWNLGDSEHMCGGA